MRLGPQTRPFRVVLSCLAIAALSWPMMASGALPSQGPALLSPAGLGPRYTGYTGAGVGLVEKSPDWGIRAGDFVILPRLFAEVGYNSNFFRASSRSVLLASSEQEGAFLTRLRPGLGVFNPSFDIVAVELSVDADIMIPVDVTESAVDVFDQFNVGGNAAATVSFFPKGALTFTISERFSRELWRRAADPTGNANRNSNNLGADVSFHPGGRAIDITAGYRWNFRFYDGLPELDRTSHDVKLLASWRFYPLTHVFLESTLNVRDYQAAPSRSEGFAGNFLNGMPLKIYLGLSGYITDRVALLLRVGYGNALLETNPDAINFENPIGMLQATFRFSAASALTVGGAYDFDTHAFGGYRWYGRAYLSLAQRLTKAILLHVDASFDYRQYGLWEPFPTGDIAALEIDQAERSDMQIQGGVLVDFDVFRWLGVSVGYRVDMVIADYSLRSPSGAAMFSDYAQHRVYTSLNLRY